MKSSNNLFLLIKSLTKSEKKYFKRYAQLYSNKKTTNYLRLFDHLNKLEKFDETEFKKKFNAGKINAQKDYLFRLILKSLISSVSKNIKQFEYREAVQECEVMISKGLLDYAEKKLT